MFLFLKSSKCFFFLSDYQFDLINLILTQNWHNNLFPILWFSVWVFLLKLSFKKNRSQRIGLLTPTDFSHLFYLFKLSTSLFTQISTYNQEQENEVRHVAFFHFCAHYSFRFVTAQLIVLCDDSTTVQCSTRV